MTELAVVAALAVEARALRKGLRGVAPSVCGMGPKRAAAFGRDLATQASARANGHGAAGAFVIAGFAGGLTRTVHPGQVVVASSVHADDASWSMSLPSAPALAVQLRAEGLDVVCAPIVSTAKLARGDQRATLAACGAVAVDMESASLLRQLNVDPSRVAVVRVIVDTPDHELLSPGLVTAGVRACRELRRVGPGLVAWANALGPRTVHLAGPRSFCAGVERAIDIVERALERFGSPVYVRRQIVHNTHVVNELERAGAVFVQELDEVPEHAHVVLAAHGVAPDVRAEAATRELHVIDATCPLVAKVHSEARRRAEQGYHIVLIGHDDHEEVVGTRGEAPTDIDVVETPDDVARLAVPDPDRVAYLTQTTLAVDETAEVVAALRTRFPAIVAPRADDICYATQNRQEAVRHVARRAELVLVIGSQNSSNSNRLVEVAAREGARAVLIEDETCLDLRWLHGVSSIAVTAGASAPEDIVQRLVATVAGLGPVELVEEPVVHEDVRFALPQEVR
jgi:4-hydroxy-3-methylbut-2-enyl diphosphate reductase